MMSGSSLTMSSGNFSRLRRSIEFRLRTSSKLGGSGGMAALLSVRAAATAAAQGQSLEIAGQVADQRAHLRVLRLEVDADAVLAQRPGRDRPDRRDDDAAEQQVWQRRGQTLPDGDLEQVAHLDLAGHDQRVDPGGEQVVEQRLERSGILGQRPAVHLQLYNDL